MLTTLGLGALILGSLSSDKEAEIAISSLSEAEATIIKGYEQSVRELIRNYRRIARALDISIAERHIGILETEAAIISLIDEIDSLIVDEPNLSLYMKSSLDALVTKLDTALEKDLITEIFNHVNYTQCMDTHYYEYPDGSACIVNQEGELHSLDQAALSTLNKSEYYINGEPKTFVQWYNSPQTKNLRTVNFKNKAQLQISCSEYDQAKGIVILNVKNIRADRSVFDDILVLTLPSGADNFFHINFELGKKQRQIFNATDLYDFINEISGNTFSHTELIATCKLIFRAIPDHLRSQIQFGEYPDINYKEQKREKDFNILLDRLDRLRTETADSTEGFSDSAKYIRYISNKTLLAEIEEQFYSLRWVGPDIDPCVAMYLSAAITIQELKSIIESRKPDGIEKISGEGLEYFIFFDNSTITLQDGKFHNLKGPAVTRYIIPGTTKDLYFIDDKILDKKSWLTMAIIKNFPDLTISVVDSSSWGTRYSIWGKDRCPYQLTITESTDGKSMALQLKKLSLTDPNEHTYIVQRHTDLIDQAKEIAKPIGLSVEDLANIIIMSLTSDISTALFS